MVFCLHVKPRDTGAILFQIHRYSVGEWLNAESIGSVASFTMQLISFIAANALLFASLILVIGVPVLYMTQSNPSDRRNREIRTIEIIGGVWFHLVLINGFVSEFIAHQF